MSASPTTSSGAGTRLRAARDFFHSVTVNVRPVSEDAGAELILRVADAAGAPVTEVRRSVTGLRDSRAVTFPFVALADSEQREYTISLEIEASDRPGGLEVESHDGQLAVTPGFGADLARLFDPWLAQSGRVLPAVPPHLERYLDRHVAECVRMKRFFFLRLAHLADAVGRLPEAVQSILAIGSGMAYQEAFLAGRLPETRILATDFDLSNGTFPMPNLAFAQLDLLDEPGPEQYDFVLSIECLEHIEDYRRAFRNQAARVKPGKYLYISVPFASREEQRDPVLRQTAWDLCEHYTPGFDFPDLEALFEENGLDVLHASNMFHVDVILPVRRIVDALDDGELEVASEALAHLLLLDLRDSRVDRCTKAEGIRFLGRKRASS